MKKMWAVLTKGEGSYIHSLASFMLILCIAVTATSCKDESLVDNPTKGGETVPAGTKLYTCIKLVQANGTYTRAEGDVEEEYEDTYPGTSDGDYKADFEPGDQKDESKIDNLLFIFYDKDGNHIAQFESESFDKKTYDDKRDPSPDDGMVSDKDDKGDKDETNDEYVIIEKIGWETLIPIELKVYQNIDLEKIKEGSYLVVLNYDEELAKALDKKSETEAAITLQEAKALQVETYQLDGAEKDGEPTKKGFLMTTAGHFGTDGNYLWYDKVPEDEICIYPSVTEAKAHARTVYVERLASRIEFEIDTKNIKPIDVLYGETDVYQLWFNPDGWAVEAQEKTSYLNKNLEYIARSGNTDKSWYESAEGYPSDFPAWIDYKNNRVFWAKSISFESPTTNPYKYPVYGDGYISDGHESISDMPLSYVTFKDILTSPVQQLMTTDANGDKSELDPEKDISQREYQQLTGMDYVLEHTFKNAELGRATNPYAVPTSAVLRGRYTATFKKTDERPDNNPDNKEIDKKLNNLEKGFYIRFVDMERTDKTPEGNNPGGERYQYHLYLEDDGTHDLNYEMLTAMLKEQFVIWIKSENGEYEYTDGTRYTPVRNNTSDVFAILNAYQRYDAVSDKFIPSSNAYTLQIKENAALPEIYLITGKGIPPVRITKDNYKKANEELMKQLGYAQHYWQAYAFFYAPIPHYAGKYDPYYPDGYTGLFIYDTEEKDGELIYKRNTTTGNYIVKHNTGDFGVVRNHIYNITITGIGSLGYGIPGEEIIPLPEPRPDHKIYQFDLELKVLPWNQFKYTFDI